MAEKSLSLEELGMAYCVKCGEQHEDGAAFCPGCGAPLGPAAATAPQQAATSPPARRRFFTKKRALLIAIIVIVAVAAAVIAGRSFLGSARGAVLTIGQPYGGGVVAY